MSTITEFDNLRAYKDGWDGNGSLSPKVETFDNALAFVALWNRPETDVTITDNGTIMFEWSGSILEVGLTTFSLYDDRHFINGKIEPRPLPASLSGGTDE
jgi:hypothetical protein